MKEKLDLSIVTTVYRSKPFLRQFINSCLDVLNEMGFKNYEIICVNDGSPDDSLEHLLSMKQDYPFIRVVNLSRNFGHHNAIVAGLSQIRSEYVFLIDCDLEVDPSILNLLYNKALETKADVVYGYQENRKGGFIEKNFGSIFWRTFNYLSDTKVPENILTERVMTRQYVESLLSLGDKNLFLGGMMSWTGFKQIGIPYLKKLRKGQSTYTFKKRFNLLLDALSSFTSKPLYNMFYLGLSTTVISIAFGLFFILRKLLLPEIVLTGFTSLITVIFFSTGVITSCLGLIGIYLSKIYNQVQNRPVYIIKEIL